MLNDVLIFLKNNLNSYLSSGGTNINAQEDQVTFLSGQSIDSLGFKPGSISLVMINLEQENVLRSPDLYSRNLSDGTVQRVQPEIRLNLYVLFVANYQQYEDALRNLSAIIQYFQKHRVFGHQDSPQLSDNIEQLVIELVTLSFAEQNEVWGSLRLPYHPSVLYKVKMVVFQDQTPKEAPEIIDKSINLL
jgi:hypothetical protein